MGRMIVLLSAVLGGTLGCGPRPVPFHKVQRIEIRDDVGIRDADGNYLRSHETIVISDKDEVAEVVRSIKIKNVNEDQVGIITPHTVVLLDGQGNVLAEGLFLCSTVFQVRKSEGYQRGQYNLASKKFAECIAKHIAKATGKPFAFSDKAPK